MTANGESSAPLLRIGLVINPLAGIGGAVGLQGSDGEAVQRAARERDGKPRGEERLSIFLQALRTRLGGDFGRLAWCTWGGVMGAQILSSYGVIAQVAGEPAAQTSAQDTQLAVKTLGESHVDLLIFVGGDGTARDVLTAVM